MTQKEERRVELRLHTTMSASISLITPKALMQEAADLGISAVAITDRESVQSFPEIARCRQRYNEALKVIYGGELRLPSGEFATVLV